MTRFTLGYLLVIVLCVSCDSKIDVLNEGEGNKGATKVELSKILDQSNAREGIEVNTIDASVNGSDFDSSGLPIEYSCSYDNTLDAAVESGSNCSLLSGLNFNRNSGVLNWVPEYGQVGTYEFKIVGTNGNSTGSSIFSISVIRESFVSVWRTGSSSEVIELPLQSGLNYDFFVDWGDGSGIEHYTSDSGVTHTYTNAGDYTVTITGLVEGWDFNSTDRSKEKIISVVNFGDMGWIDLQDAFYDCSNLESFSGGGTFRVTDFSYMFQNTPSLANIDLSNFKTTSAESLAGMFSGANAIRTLDLSSFDTKKVQSMEDMFYNATSLILINLSSFDTSSVEVMAYMFQNTTNLLSLDLNHFDTSSVISMAQMFDGASSLSRLDLSSFDTRMVSDMDAMFRSTTKLGEINANGWKLDHGPSGSGIFTSANSDLEVFCDPTSLGTADFFGEACL